jgi:hypothetical protein
MLIAPSCDIGFQSFFASTKVKERSYAMAQDSLHLETQAQEMVQKVKMCQN